MRTCEGIIVFSLLFKALGISHRSTETEGKIRHLESAGGWLGLRPHHALVLKRRISDRLELGRLVMVSAIVRGVNGRGVNVTLFVLGIVLRSGTIIPFWH